MSRLIPELFFEQAAEHPDAPAVISASGTLSYRDLARSARRLAKELVDLGVERESVVAFLLLPGPEMVVAIMGIWLAGGCYLPLDVLSPDARLSSTIEESRALFVLVDEAMAERGARLSPTAGVHRVDRLIAGGSVEFAPDSILRSQAAYVLYTSGSTGSPKGVLIQHEGIANLARWGLKAHNLGREDRILQKTPITFDAAGWEIFCPLICGAPVTFGRPDAGRDPAELVASIQERDITVLQVVPTMLRLLAAEPDLASCKSLRLVCAGGEPLRAELCQRVLAQLDVEIWNLYGPTECSINALGYRFDPAQLDGAVPIGRPIDGIQIVTSPAEEAEDAEALTRDGGLSELYLSGPGLARGYHRDPQRTAQSFLPMQEGPAGSRMYRTGDLVRRLPNGTYEFIGRIDTQVKINGVRVELGEVETTLASHPSVVEAAVRVDDGSNGAKRLAAWVVVSHPGTAASLTGFLRDRLPPALVPALITEIDAIPRTSSGKTDRARLPEPVWDAPADTAPKTPLTAEQRIVIACWQQVLGVEQCGLDDDFFRLGGHSLLLTQLAALLCQMSGLDVGLRELHYNATVAQQAELLRQAGELRPITPAPGGSRLTVSHAQERFWILDRVNPRSHEYLLPILIRLPADTTADIIDQALAVVVARHEILRTRFVMDSQGLTAVVEPAKSIAVKLRSHDGGPGHASAMITQMLENGFDLSAAPLWRAAVVRDGADEPLLVLVCHHIIGDGWSSQIIESEIRERVAELRAGLDPQRTVTPLGFFDASAWLRSQLSEELLTKQLGYWHNTLADLPVLELPGIGRLAPQRDIAGDAVMVELPASSVKALVALARQAGTTPYVALLTLWTIALARAAGQWDFGVASPHAGRGRPELHAIVGPFADTLVLRPGLDPDLCFTDALARVERTCREAFVHSDAPFESVVDGVVPVRDLSRTSLFQNLFTFTGDDQFGHVPGSREVELLAQSWKVSRTDLELALWMYRDGHVEGLLGYASALYREDTAEDLAHRLRELADSFAADPELAIGSPGIDGS